VEGSSGEEPIKPGGISDGQLQALPGSKAEQLTDLAAVDSCPGARPDAELLAGRPEQRFERVDPGRDPSRFDPADRRLRHARPDRELPLGEPGLPARLSKEESGVHATSLALR
jgi:hypothetical protein